MFVWLENLFEVTPLRRLACYGRRKVMDELMAGDVPDVKEAWEAMRIGSDDGMVALTKVFDSFSGTPEKRQFFDDMPKDLLERGTMMGVSRHLLGQKPNRIVRECAAEGWFPEFLEQCVRADSRFLSERNSFTMSLGHSVINQTVALAPQHIGKIAGFQELLNDGKQLVQLWRHCSGENFDGWYQSAMKVCKTPNMLRDAAMEEELIAPASGDEALSVFIATGKPREEFDDWVLSRGYPDELVRQADAAAESRGWTSFASDAVEPLELPAELFATKSEVPYVPKYRSPASPNPGTI